MTSVTENLLHRLQERGFRSGLLSIERLSDLQEDIGRWHHQGLLDEEFYQERMAWLDFQPPADLADPHSIIVVANPQPQVRLAFDWEGETVPVIVPPTYVHRQPDQEVRDALLGAVGPVRLALARAALPVKLLAVRSGLARYGRNNVCYVPGFGSFHRLVAFYSDLPCDDDTWHELEMMDSCHGCEACVRACPTGAITADRFLLRAERCLTFHNERAVPFPAWLDRSWHSSLVGCLECQRVCPENKAYLDWTEPGPEFCERETALLLESESLEGLPGATREKLGRLDLVEYVGVLGRNLAALLAVGQGSCR